MNTREEERAAPRPGAAIVTLDPARRAVMTLSVPLWLVASRIGVALVLAHVTLRLFPQSRQRLAFAILDPGTWLGAFDRWDAAYYVGVAGHGYPRGAPAMTAFFPGYPVVVRVVWEVTFGVISTPHAATLVSWLAFGGAAAVLYSTVSARFGGRAAAVGTALFCWSPASLFFLSPYSESLFALEIVAVLALLYRERFLAAAVVAAVASATSPESVALTVAIVVAAWLARRPWRMTVGYAAVSLVGLAAYMVYLQARFGDLLAFDRAQKSWHRSLNFPFLGLARNLIDLGRLPGSGPAPGGPSPTYDNIRAVWVVDDVMLLLAAVLAGYMLWRGLRGVRGRRAAEDLVRRGPFPLPWLAVTTIILAVAACTTIYPYGSTHLSSTEGEARFVAVAMPLYGGLSYLLRRRPGLALAAVCTSAAVAVVAQMMYNLGYWVT